MARRYHEIKGLAEFTAKTIVSDEEQWKKFLHTAELAGKPAEVKDKHTSLKKRGSRLSVSVEFSREENFLYKKF